MHPRLFSLGLGLAAAMASLPALAQAPAPSVIFTGSGDFAGLIAKARADHKPGAPTTVEPVLRLAPYNVNLEYRTGVGPAAVHETEAELFYVLDGSGTLVTGGKLTGETRTNAANLSGTGIEGGASRHVAKGDVFIVPQNTPHWYSAIDGTLILMSMHVPRTGAN